MHLNIIIGTSILIAHCLITISLAFPSFSYTYTDFYLKFHALFNDLKSSRKCLTIIAQWNVTINFSNIHTHIYFHWPVKNWFIFVFWFISDLFIIFHFIRKFFTQQKLISEILYLPLTRQPTLALSLFLLNFILFFLHSIYC